jgi:hypothetical protein
MDSIALLLKVVVMEKEKVMERERVMMMVMHQKIQFVLDWIYVDWVEKKETLIEEKMAAAC